MLDYKKLFKKNKYVAYVSGSGIKRHFVYNSSRTEMQLDIMWLFMFGNAKQVTIAYLKNGRTGLKTYTSLKTVQEEWTAVFGPSANYMIWHDRIRTKEI